MQYNERCAMQAGDGVWSGKASVWAGEIVFLPTKRLFAPLEGRISARNRNAVIRLASTIGRYGVSEPLLVRRVEGVSQEERYEIVEGALCWQAACLVGMDKLPCAILENDPQKAMESAIFEQIRQKELHIFAQADAFRRLMTEHGLTQGEIARRLGISQSAVANKLRLLQYEPQERQTILQKGLSERHARTLLRLKSPSQRAQALSILTERGLTVAETEELVESFLRDKKAEASEKELIVPQGKKTAESGQKTGDAAVLMPQSPFLATQSPPLAPPNPCSGFSHFSTGGRQTVRQQPPRGIIPNKFALASLQPLYNSIERTLSIFRKTGYSAEMAHEEGPEGILITITIPPKA